MPKCECENNKKLAVSKVKSKQSNVSNTGKHAHDTTQTSTTTEAKNIHLLHFSASWGADSKNWEFRQWHIRFYLEEEEGERECVQKKGDICFLVEICLLHSCIDSRCMQNQVHASCLITNRDILKYSLINWNRSFSSLRFKLCYKRQQFGDYLHEECT